MAVLATGALHHCTIAAIKIWFFDLWAQWQDVNKTCENGTLIIG